MLQRIKDAVDNFQQRRAVTAFPYAVLKKFGEDRAGQQAALLAYYGFFSLFPLLLFAVTILGMILRDNPELQQRILDSALAQFPIIGEDIRSNLGDLGRSGTALLIGLLGALWAGLAGVKALQNALNHVWDVPVRRQPGVPAQLARGLMLLGLLGGFMIVSTGLASSGTEGATMPVWVRVLTFAGSVSLNIVVFAIAYKVATVADVSWRDVAPGAVFGAVAWLMLQATASYFVGTRLQHASELYGFFGIVIGLLSWMYLGGQITLLGAEINVVRKGRLWPRSMVDDDLEEADKRTLARHAREEERVEDEKVAVRFEEDREEDASRSALQ